MEDLIKFNQSIELSPDARKLMLGMIRSMQSIVPSGPVLVPEDTSGYHCRFTNFYTAEVLKLSRENEDLFEEIIDPAILEKYIANTKNFKELGDHLEKLLNAIRTYEHLSGYLSHKLAGMMKEHIDIVRPSVCESLDQKLSGADTGAVLKKNNKQGNINLKVV